MPPSAPRKPFLPLLDSDHLGPKQQLELRGKPQLSTWGKQHAPFLGLIRWAHCSGEEGPREMPGLDHPAGSWDSWPPRLHGSVETPTLAHVHAHTHCTHMHTHVPQSTCLFSLCQSRESQADAPLRASAAATSPRHVGCQPRRPPSPGGPFPPSPQGPQPEGWVRSSVRWSLQTWAPPPQWDVLSTWPQEPHQRSLTSNILFCCQPSGATDV